VGLALLVAQLGPGLHPEKLGHGHRGCGKHAGGVLGDHPASHGGLGVALFGCPGRQWCSRHVAGSWSVEHPSPVPEPGHPCVPGSWSAGHSLPVPEPGHLCVLGSWSADIHCWSPSWVTPACRGALPWVASGMRLPWLPANTRAGSLVLKAGNWSWRGSGTSAASRLISDRKYCPVHSFSVQ